MWGSYRVTLPDSSYLDYTYDAAHRLTGITITCSTACTTPWTR